MSCIVRALWADPLGIGLVAAARTGSGEKSGASATPPPPAVRVAPVDDRLHVIAPDCLDEIASQIRRFYE